MRGKMEGKMQGKMREGEMDGDSSTAKEVQGVRNLSGREMLSCMREEFFVCAVVVVLMVVVRMVCLGAVEVECLEVFFMTEGNIFELGGSFVVVVV